MEPSPRLNWLGCRSRAENACSIRGGAIHYCLGMRIERLATDAPEVIPYSTVDRSGDLTPWQNLAPSVVLAPKLSWEGSDLPLEPSRRGAINTPVNQLRDPAIFLEANRIFLLYSAAGESSIGIAEIEVSGSDRSGTLEKI
jgi:hypothetical protein